MEAATADKRQINMHDTYFRRFLVPVVITLLVFALMFVIIRDTGDMEPTTLFSGGARRLIAKLFHRRR